jgi:hypothetical protein
MSKNSESPLDIRQPFMDDIEASDLLGGREAEAQL